jgi:hypothetical protein
VCGSGDRGLIFHFEDLLSHPVDDERLHLEVLSPHFEEPSIFEMSPIHKLLVLHAKSSYKVLDYPEPLPLVRVSWEPATLIVSNNV